MIQIFETCVTPQSKSFRYCVGTHNKPGKEADFKQRQDTALRGGKKGKITEVWEYNLDV